MMKLKIKLIKKIKNKMTQVNSDNDTKIIS
jgi:hypothetical protein